MSSSVVCGMSPAGFIAYSAFVGSLVALIVYCIMVTVIEPQEERPKMCQCRDNKGDARGQQPLGNGSCPAETPTVPTCPLPHPGTPAVFLQLEPLQSLQTDSGPVHLDTDTDTVNEIIHQFIRTHEDITRLLDSLKREMPEGSDNSLTSIMACEASSPAEVSLSPSSNNSPTSLMASNFGSSSWVSLPTPVDGAGMAHASSIQPGLGHPRPGPLEQSGPATHPPCGEEMTSCLEASSMQQYEQDLKIQLGAPTPAPEVPEVHSGEMEMPPHHIKGQETLEDVVPESKPEQELGLPVNVEDTPQNVPASAPPTPQRPEEHHVTVVPIVQDLPFLDDAVKRKLEHLIFKMKIQRLYGLQTRLLECEQSFENLILE